LPATAGSDPGWLYESAGSSGKGKLAKKKQRTLQEITGELRHTIKAKSKKSKPKSDGFLLYGFHF
jgi:hypothetical protein